MFMASPGLGPWERRPIRCALRRAPLCRAGQGGIVTVSWASDRERVTAAQLRGAQRQVSWAYERSKFYRPLWDRAGVTPAALTSLRDLQQWPMITKPEVIDAQATAPPFGPVLCVDPASVIRMYIAAGPVCHGFDAEDYVAYARLFGKGFAEAGLRPGDRVDVTAMYHWVAAGTILDEGVRLAGACAIPGGVGNTRTHLENAKLTRTTVIYAFSTFAEHLAEEVKAMGWDARRDLSIRLFLVGGEMSSDAAKRNVAETFNAEIREFYGTAESGQITFDCGRGPGMHVLEECILEVVDPVDGRPVEPGAPGEVVLTELVRRAMPYVRYRTGDLTEGLDDTPCPCGRPTPRLKRIIGRSDAIPRVKGIFLPPKQVRKAVDAVGGLGRFQLVIDRPGVADVLTIRAEQRAAGDAKVVAQRLKDSMKSVIGLKVEVELVPEGSIVPTAPDIEDRRKL
jgi:phenylacetate-coenzyme A ligase PaaK-like adenylate-forming protein